LNGLILFLKKPSEDGLMTKFLFLIN